jgi:hypothetical protein
MRLEKVAFITIESDDDLILSFAIEGDNPGEVRSLILMRTPKYESILDEAERGVSVSHEDYPEDDHELLEEIEFGLRTTVVSRRRKYSLSLRGIPATDMEKAVKILRKMNFDRRFKLRIV